MCSYRPKAAVGHKPAKVLFGAMCRDVEMGGSVFCPSDIIHDAAMGRAVSSVARRAERGEEEANGQRCALAAAFNDAADGLITRNGAGVDIGWNSTRNVPQR